MAKPAFLYDNRLDDGTLSGSAVAAGFARENLRDWRPYTFWQPTGIPANIQIDAASLAYEFTASADGWTGVNTTITTNPTSITSTATAVGPQLKSPAGLAIDGAANRYVVARIQRSTGSSWDGTVFYSNAKHGLSVSYLKTIADPTGGTPGGWVIAVWDMHDLTLGGDDWKGGTITDLRVDLQQASGEVFHVDWIALLPDFYADYALIWGHDMGSQGVDLEVYGSNVAPGTWTIFATADPETDAPFMVTFAQQAYRWWQVRFDTGAASGAPTVAIIALGNLLEAPQGLGSGFDPLGRRPMGKLSTAVGGGPLGRAIDYEEWRQTLTFPFVGWDWLRESWEPAWTAHLRDDPFILAWDRVGKPSELHLVAAAGGFDTPHRKAVADLSLEVVGVALER